jgi:hypothetical protein
MLLRSLQRALPASATARIVVGTDGGTVEIPLVYVDAESRPDVADLPRVYRAEGTGATSVRWLLLSDGRSMGLAVLTIRVRRPVRCRFRILFDLQSHAAFLADVARAGGLTVTCVNPNEEPERSATDGTFYAVPVGPLGGAGGFQQAA